MGRGDRREDILRAAERVVRNRRYHEIKLDEIAREAGVGKGTLYLYFRDKEDLFSQFVAEGFDALCDVVYQAISSGRPFREKLDEMAVAVTTFMEERGSLIRVAFEEERRKAGAPPGAGDGHGARLKKRHARLHEAGARLMEQGVAEGHLRGNLPSVVLSHMFMGLLHSRHMLRKLDGVLMEPRQFVDLFLEGAGSRGEGKSP